MRPKDIATKANIARKDEVIRVAARLFAAKGYHATTLDEIAKEVGIAKPSLYYYIINKEDILRKIMDIMKEQMEEVVAMGRSKLPPKERMENIIRILVKHAAESKEFTLIAFEQGNILPQRSMDALRRRQKELEKVVQQTLEEGIKGGCFIASDIKMTCFAILAVANWLYRWYQTDGRLTPTEITEQFIKLLEHGYLHDGCPH